QEHAWPRALAVAFTRHNLLTGIALAAMFSAIFAVAASTFAGGDGETGSADFYAVIPHGVMVAVFGVVFLFAIVAMTTGVVSFVRGLTRGLTPGQTPVSFRDIFTLRHLHAS